MPTFSDGSRSDPVFAGLDDVLEAHEDQLRRFGGDRGVRDLGLLKSALAQPMATFGDQFLHNDIFEMAAAYIFHIVKNHPFVDGNKRAGLHIGLIFLEANGVAIAPSDAFYDMTMAVAEGRLGKPEIAELLRRFAKP